MPLLFWSIHSSLHILMAFVHCLLTLPSQSLMNYLLWFTMVIATLQLFLPHLPLPPYLVHDHACAHFKLWFISVDARIHILFFFLLKMGCCCTAELTIQFLFYTWNKFAILISNMWFIPLNCNIKHHDLEYLSFILKLFTCNCTSLFVVKF